MLKNIPLFALGYFLSVACQGQSYVAYTIAPVYLTDSSSSHQVVHTGKGDALILTSLAHPHGKYKAVHVKSKKHGYVNVHDILIEKTLPNSEEDVLASMSNSEVKNPIIKVHNKSKKVMTIVLNQDKYDIEPRTTATIQVKSGKYHSKVLIENTEPIYSFDNLEDYKLYEWNYFVQ